MPTLIDMIYATCAMIIGVGSIYIPWAVLSAVLVYAQ